MHAEIFYKEQLQISESQIQFGVKKVRLFTFLRLLVFAVFGSALYLVWGNTFVFIILSLLGITAFLVMVSKSVDAKLTLEKARELKRINEVEILALHGDWSNFESGQEFSTGMHPFSNDLDLFAPKGIYGFLNRTVSAEGKGALAELLLNGSENPKRNNEIIEALSHEIAWTQKFRVSGSINSREKGVNQSFKNWFAQKLVNPNWVKSMMYIIPSISIPALILYNFDLISSMVFGTVITVSMSITGSLLKSTNLIAESVSKYAAKAAVMLDQIRALNELKVEDNSLREIKNEFSKADLNAIDGLKKFLKINKQLDLRMNILISIPLNIFFAWDLNQRIEVERWKVKYENAFLEWEKTLVKLEVYVSGATVKFNSPDSIFADFSEDMCIQISGLMHPLLNLSKAISNEVKMDQNNQFIILTGPNMAGKSTFLRSLGLVFVFANAGFPVFADSAKIPKVKLYSSMRTSDDLSNESSYFHAELTRLKFIMDALNQNQAIFILLDEILKGTNSKDKEEGSKKFLKKLQSKGAKGIIATHDLSLCELSNENQVFINACFDSTIEGENLFFDYTLKSGICKNMNASFLLKKMQLVD
jgi:predicted ATPase